MEKKVIEEIRRIHSIIYDEKTLLEQNFFKNVLEKFGNKNIYHLLTDAANSGGLFQEKQGQIKYNKNVKALQSALISLGYDLPRYGADGLFGNETAIAVDRFKKSNNIPSDNTHASPETIKLIIKQLKSKKTSPDVIEKNIPQKKQINKIILFFIQKGLTIEQSSGILANLYMESKLNPNAIGDNGISYGMAQWNKDRLQNLKSTIPNWNTIDGQLKFLWYELNTTEKKALEKLKQARTPNESAYLFAKYYERPASSNYSKREMLANNIFTNYKNES